jgi:hypothetical protein
MLPLQTSTAAPSTATGSIYSFTAKESSYYKITVTNGEIGITTNGVTQWLLPQDAEGGNKVATYEVKLEKGDTYVFQIRNSEENATAQIDPVKYEIGLENMFDANGATLADMGKTYTANMVPSKLYDLTIPTEIADSVYVAGAAIQDGVLVTNGGRVLGATAIADSLPAAIEASYQLVEQIHFDNAYYRHDIGARALQAQEV